MIESELILHHYDFSNYSEKIRVVMGFKGLSWRSVIMPSVAPKPDLLPLTGGYRKAPVLQIGADIFCDTNLILRELERRKPTPSLYPAVGGELAPMLVYWAETQLFRPISLYVSGSHPELFPLSLQADRAKMRGLPPPDADTMRRAAERSAPLVRSQLRLIERMFDDGRPFVLGSMPTVADFAIYHALWFITARTLRLQHELDAVPAALPWLARMKSFGHGTFQPMSAIEALEVAARLEPEAPRPSVPYGEDPRVGQLVRVRADDYGRETVEGVLVQIDANEMALCRADPHVGTATVHFPRLGYELRSLEKP